MITAAATATLVESSSAPLHRASEWDDASQLDRIDQRLARIEATLARQSPGAEPMTSSDHEHPGPEGAESRRAALRRRRASYARLVYRDPEHVTERLTLCAADRPGEPNGMGDLRAQPAIPILPRLPRSYGALGAGRQNRWRDRRHALLLALVPGYLTYLTQEVRMTLRIAALYGRDPRSCQPRRRCSRCAACTQTSTSAEAALVAVQGEGAARRARQAAIAAHVGT